MKKWKPITEIELIEQIQKTETELNGELWNFWQLIRIDPEKWQEPEFGNEGDGFWVVAICGKKVIWYNDIEEGFNISDYKDYRKIEGYYCNQDELNWSVMRLYDLIKFGGDIIGQAGPPQSLKTEQYMWQKLTYSGNECNNYLYFSFDAEFFDTDEVTNIIGIKPTSLMTKKEPVPKSTSWKYRIDVGNDTDLETPLEELIEIFEPKIDTINKLKNSLNLETRIQFVIDIDINPESSTPYFGLSKRVIKFLHLTETVVDFDVYKADTIGMLEEIDKSKST